MSLFARQQKRLFGIPDASALIPPRTGGTAGSVRVTNESALRHSAVWACLRLRANLLSTMPLDVFRQVGDLQINMPTPPVLAAPGGERWDYVDWMHATQFDLDRCGNTVGLITETNSLGLPARIDLQAIDSVSIIDRRDSGLVYRIGGKDYDPARVWHERQYPMAGLPVGLSPVAYAAWTIGQYESAQKFALEWYGSGGIPKAHFQNTTQEMVDPKVAEAMKIRFKASTEGRDVFVTGKDWVYSPIQSAAVGAEWLDAQKFGIGDVARFFDVPGDLIDAAVQGANLTYANVTQRNLQFLIMSLGPAIIRRERALSKLLPAPRYVKLNTSALLRMDDETRANVIATRISSRTLGNDEARKYENLPPLTDAQIELFDRLFTVRRISETVQSGDTVAPGSTPPPQPDPGT